MESDDGQYYDVVVEEVTETGYRVLFTAYEGEDGDREELPIEHLRIPTRRRGGRRGGGRRGRGADEAAAADAEDE